MNSIGPTEDTIAAISSAINIAKGGIAVLRVSGPEAINACKLIVETKSRNAWKSHKVFYG